MSEISDKIKLIIQGKHGSIEKRHRADTDKLRWGKYTDVLYSFRGIFTLGVYILDDKEEYSIWKNNTIVIKNQGQRLYSADYLSNNYNKFPNIEALEEILSNFTDIYTDIGNLQPIWPGGNSVKGTVGCYDIPDIFYQNVEYRKMELLYLENILEIDPKDAFLDEILYNADFPDISRILNFSQKEYAGLVNRIVETIQSRNKNITDKL